MVKATLGLDSMSPADVLRLCLERRAFANASALELSEESAPVARHATFFEAISFMEAPPEALREVVTSLLGTLHSANVELLVWVHGDGQRLRFFYGAVSPTGAKDVDPRHAEVLEQALDGFLRGAKLRRVSSVKLSDSPDEALPEMRASLERRGSVAAIIGIPSDRATGERLSHIDEALEGVAFRNFDLIIQCVPSPDRDVDIATSNLSLISATAHQLSRTTFSQSEGANLSRSVTEGITQTFGQSVTRSWSTGTSSTAAEHTNAQSVALAQGIGTLLGAALGGVVSAACGISEGVQVGKDVGLMLAGAVVPPHQIHRGTNSSTGTSTGTTDSTALAKSRAETLGASLGMQWSAESLDRSALALESIAEAHLERVQRGRALGAWSVSVHVCANDDSTRNVVSHLLVGALRGDRTHLEKLVALPYTRASVDLAIRSVSAFAPPLLRRVAPHPFFPHGEQPCTLLASDELAQWVMPPSGDVAGVRVDRPVRFARGLALKPTSRGGIPTHITLGPPTHWGRPNPRGAVSIHCNELARHVFIAGTTGSGKTTTLRRILWELARARIPFLVIEPAKSSFAELRERMIEDGLAPLRLVLGRPANEHERTLKFNPFAAPAGIPLGRHAEAVKILLRSCFDMQESLPQLLELLLFRTYEFFGWTDLLSPITSEQLQRPFPCFRDFLVDEVAPGRGRQSRVAATVNRFGYEERIANSLTAALTVRLESFTRGIKGHIFDKQEIDFGDVLSRPCFLELADLSEPDVRRFLIGALLLRIYAEREAQRRVSSPDGTLRHAIVLEEAHHVLRESTGSGPSAALIQQSNLLLADAFAELREYGQGIIVADQAPGDLQPAVLRNTATKIVHTLYHEADVRAIGDAIGLDDAQRAELRRLRRGECVVNGSDFPAPVTCMVQPISSTRKVTSHA